MRDYTTLHSDTNDSKLKQLLVVRKNMDVTEHERVYNMTLRHRLK